jgi:hypothetical protein
VIGRRISGSFTRDRASRTRSSSGEAVGTGTGQG